MTEEKPIREDRKEDVDTSYDDAMQARLDRLAERAQRVRRRNMLWSLGTFFVLVLLTGGLLLFMKQCRGGKGFEDSFGWLKRRR